MQVRQMNGCYSLFLGGIVLKMMNKMNVQRRAFLMASTIALTLGAFSTPLVSANEGDIITSGVSEQVYDQITSTTAVDYAATISRGTDGINTQPWGTEGYQTIGYSSDYLGVQVTVSQEKMTGSGVTWALIAKDGKEIGWIATAALTVLEQTYAQVLSTTAVDYPAIVKRGTDAINTAPWGVNGWRTIAFSSDYLDADFTVSEEKVMDSGVTWALISLDGQELGWIAKDALTVQEYNYAKVLSTTAVNYKATIIRATDAVNTQPWGAKGWETLGYTAAYQWKEVSVSQEKVMDSGVTWALISLNGQQLGWVAKDAFYAQVISAKNVDYPAVVNRGTDAINSQPWGVKGWQTIGNTVDLIGKEVSVSQEKMMDSGMTWALITVDGKELGWVAKDALTVRAYVQIVSTKTVAYKATIISGIEAIGNQPFGTKGSIKVGNSSDYQWKEVSVSQEKVTDNGITWALTTYNGKELGWINKEAFYEKILSTTNVNYTALVYKDSEGINTLPWGVKGYQTIGISSAYLGKTVTVIQEKVTASGVTWGLFRVDGKEIGWMAIAGMKILVDKIVYLDPGHGGYESGAAYSGVQEKTINMLVSNQVKANLEGLGLTVIMSRTTDEYVGLFERSAEANASGADIFVSVHHNAMPGSTTVSGIETYYYQAYPEYPSIINEAMHNDPTRILESAQLASDIHTTLVENTGAVDRGIKRNTFAVLRETAIPAVLLELGYMSSPTELAKLNSTVYQTTLAKAISNGIVTYLK